MKKKFIIITSSLFCIYLLFNFQVNLRVFARKIYLQSQTPTTAQYYQSKEAQPPFATILSSCANTKQEALDKLNDFDDFYVNLQTLEEGVNSYMVQSLETDSRAVYLFKCNYFKLTKTSSKIRNSTSQIGFFGSQPTPENFHNLIELLRESDVAILGYCFAFCSPVKYNLGLVYEKDDLIFRRDSLLGQVCNDTPPFFCSKFYTENTYTLNKKTGEVIVSNYYF